MSFTNHAMCPPRFQYLLLKLGVDVVAATFLGVGVSPKATWELLVGRPEDFTILLAEIPNLVLAELYPEEAESQQTGWRLWNLLRERLRAAAGLVGPLWLGVLRNRYLEGIQQIGDECVVPAYGH